MEKIFSELYRDLHDATFISSDPLKNYLFSNKHNLLILFFIASKPDQKCTLEDVCYNISSKIISRSTIQYILKEGVEIGFFEKIINEKDKREKYYKITPVGKKNLEDWAISQKKVFSNLNNFSSK
tara:strand:- start:334 stop:708 length:375 start_codon:yes stop_codon:yes gene_type:complete